MKSTTPISFAALLAFSLAAPMAWGQATLGNNVAVQVTSSTNPTALISVNPGNEGWSSDSTTLDEAFNAPVVAYALFNDSATPVASAGGLISNLSSSFGSDDKLSLWTASDPNSNPADVTGAGVRWTPESTFTVDISTLTNDSVYTTYGNPQDIIATLPEEDRFQVGEHWLVRPDTETGYLYFKKIIETTMKDFPALSQITVWWRGKAGTDFGGLTLSMTPSELPAAWRPAYDAAPEEAGNIFGPGPLTPTLTTA